MRLLGSAAVKTNLIDIPDRRNCTPLYYAAADGDLAAVRMLVQGGSNINRPCYKSRTPMHAAFRSDNLELVTFLIEEGGDLNAMD
jgi:ankyrin repeat protein